MRRQSLKASALLTDNIDVEGNFGYVNHFEGRFAPTVLDQSYGILPRTVWPVQLAATVQAFVLPDQRASSDVPK